VTPAHDGREPPRLPVENLRTARFRCVFPACGGICCRNGRPTVDDDERARVDANLAKFLPLLRPRARGVVEARGWLTNRVKGGLRSVAVADGWCVFENGGCVLQRAGALEGERWRYKPAACIRFPLDRDRDGTWYVRQWGHRGEAWDLFCLNPAEDATPAEESLRDEVAFVAQCESAAAGGGPAAAVPADQPGLRPSDAPAPGEPAGSG
jgi:hypothetical protein